MLLSISQMPNLSVKNKNFKFMSKNTPLISFEGKKDSFTKEEKDSVNKVLRTPKLLKTVLAAAAISSMTLGGMTSCNGNSNKQRYQDTYQSDTQESNKVSSDYQVESLSPDEWLKEWNTAWNECWQEAPEQKQGLHIVDPNADIMEQSLPQAIIKSDKDVFEIMKQKHPDLIIYLEKQEYAEKLKEQTEKAEKILQDQQQAMQEAQELRDKKAQMIRDEWNRRAQERIQQEQNRQMQQTLQDYQNYINTMNAINQMNSSY